MDDVDDGRDGRGASYMDQYDAQADSGGYSGAEKSSSSSSGCTTCTKYIVFVVNFIMLLIGVVLIVVVFYVKENGGSSDLPIGLNDTVVYMTVISGALIIIVSFLGCVGASSGQKCILIVFIILLVLCLLLELAGIVITFADKSLVRNGAESQWNNLSAEGRSGYETDNSCLGFDDCYDSIEKQLQNNMMIVGGITIGIFVYQLIMTIFACCLCTKLGKGGDGIDGQSWNV